MDHPELIAAIFAIATVACLVILSSGITWIQYLFIFFAAFTIKNIFMYMNGWRTLFYKDFKIEENDE